ncbi:Hsp20/alpha crystallin family protein [bacterium]|jgi:HSP20 family protein|nr:Hsp20/alpha crystallin family protein [bacterium]
MTYLTYNQSGSDQVWNTLLNWEPFNTTVSTDFQAPVDIKESDATITITTDLPGINKDDITIEYHDELLTISAKKSEDDTSKNETITHSEIRRGAISRTLSIGDIEFDNAKADYLNGQLRLTIPKSEKDKPRRLKIT